jgi:hypothetical protein
MDMLGNPLGEKKNEHFGLAEKKNATVLCSVRFHL